MSVRANPTLIGAFVVGAVTLGALAIITFGGKSWWQKEDQIIMYFSGSVYGLNTGAPVSVRGVKIGTVRQINIIFNTETGDFRVPVIADLNPGSIEAAQQLRINEGDEDPIRTLIEKLGLRAQLQLQSILTAQLYIELDYHPETPVQYFGDGSMLEVPTIPTAIDQLDKVLDKISLEDIADDFTSALTALKRLLNSPEIMETITTIKGSFQEMDALSRELREKVAILSGDFDATLADIRKLSAEMNLAFQKTNRLIAEDSPQIVKLNTALTEISTAAEEIAQAARTISALQDSPEVYRLNEALEEITQAARAMRELAETIESQPESLLRGKQSNE
jgi:paraquat-inducible protein B